MRGYFFQAQLYVTSHKRARVKEGVPYLFELDGTSLVEVGL